MTTAESFRALFANWPKEVPVRGIVLSKLNEANLFKGFMLAETMIVLERTSPDSLGARYAVMPYEEIVAVKFIDPLRGSVFEGMGFAGKLSQ